MELHSFVRPRNRNLFKGTVLSESEWLEGIYINDPNDFLLITNIGLNWIHDNVMHVVPYDSLVSVDLADDEKRILLLRQHDGTEVAIAVLNDTEERSDVYVIQEFLNSMIYFPHHSWSPEAIKEIETQDDLSDFLDDQPRGWWKYGNLGPGLKEGFPYPWQLTHFNIDPELLRRPDVWRLMALMLCCDEDDDQCDDRVPRLPNLSISAKERFFEVGDPEPPPVKTDDEHGQELETVPFHLRALLGIDSRLLLVIASEEAARFGLHYLGAEFILFALASGFPELTRELLNCPGLTKNAIKEELRSMYGSPPGKGSELTKVNLNPRTIKLIELAWQKAVEVNSPILPNHILIAMHLIDEGPVPLILEKLRKEKS